MECNKEEALRAKEMAEIRLAKGEFSGALRVAQRAQRLFPELENISQLLAVCEVHTSAEKMFGSEKDWYGVLQIEKTADEMAIMKQYRKLALLLHPDKNKFAGSEAAFKLIGEAKRILSDREKRSLYDIKLRSFSNNGQQYMPPYVPNKKSVAVPRKVESFLTVCSTCRVEHWYLKELLGREVRCQTCRTLFKAYENGKETGATTSSHRGSGAARKESFHDAPPKAAKGAGYHYNPVSKVSSDNNSCLKSQKGVNVTAKEGDRKDGIGSMPKVTRKVENTSNSKTNSRKRQRNDHTAGSGITSEKVNGEANVENVGNPDQSGCDPNLFHPSRKSTRQKQHVSYHENMQFEDVDHLVSPNKSRTSDAGKDGSYVQENVGSSAATEDKSNVKSTGPNDGATSDDNKAASPMVLSCPDAEFCDFEKHKEEGCFAVNQVWAIYDECDGMPRYYAQVRKVLSPGFKLKIVWFEADPYAKDQDEVNWCLANLPVACGRYSFGGSEVTEDRLMFSHQIMYSNVARRGTFLIYPRKGETWALFMNWDIKWSLEPEKHSSFRYEFVEVLSDFVEGSGITVAYLDKVKGFVSLFQPTEANSFQIPRTELYRFSHRIPSFRITNEGIGVPEGSFEFDPASLPSEIFAPCVGNSRKNNDSHDDGGHSGGGCGSSASQDKTQPPKPSEEIKSPRKSNFEGQPSTVRRSPRGSSKRPQVNSDSTAKEDQFTNIEEAQEDNSTYHSKLNSPIKHMRNGVDRDTLPVRRSPRSLHKSE
ncbi:hypothetical protein SAY86_006897 [Trapa natans]|uniref:J domain-containing protein n=1 Tax=Trapa natans TaxID=22666 RepID=A0AAN7L878_TRANT|nr:hypothetical protein SAY86_006897 [Trapa natans]